MGVSEITYEAVFKFHQGRLTKYDVKDYKVTFFDRVHTILTNRGMALLYFRILSPLNAFGKVLY